MSVLRPWHSLRVLPLALLLAACSSTGPSGIETVATGPAPPQAADLVLVKKGERRLYLIKDGQPFRSYKVSLGRNPVGDKLAEGDGRTPEGEYVINWRKGNSQFYKALSISYPSVDDRLESRALGLRPGGAIMIHGQPSDPRKAKPYLQSLDWTEGCIAVHNAEMDEIWLAVRTGTPIRILP